MTRPLLVCLHHAGGGPSAFHGWRRELADVAEVLVPCLPGHQQRIREPRHRDLETLVEAVDAELAEQVGDGGHVLFGHSMGGLLAYRVALRQVAAGRAPRLVVVIGYASPRRSLIAPGTDLEEVGLQMAELGRLPPELLANEQWRQHFWPVLLDDLAVCAGHRSDAGPLPVPLLVLHGEEDPLVPADVVREWGSVAADLTVHQVPGGHFVIGEQRGAVLALLRAQLAAPKAVPTVEVSPARTA